MKKFLIILLVFVYIFAVGCENPFKRGGNELSEEGNQGEPQPFPVIIDGVTIEESPNDIVCLSPALTEILYEFGQGDRLIGRSEYCNFPLSVKNAEIIQSGSSFDIEEVIKLAPNLLLLSSSIPEKDRITLEREGIATIVIPAPKSLDEFRNVYRLVGLILHGVFVGEDEGDAVFSDINKACNNPDAIDLGDFIYITENMSIATGDTLESSVLSCFGNNLAEDATGYVFDKAELLINQPDTIILNGIYSIDDLISEEGDSDEIFSQLEAITKGRIIILNNVYFERPSARLITLISDMHTQYFTI